MHFSQLLKGSNGHTRKGHIGKNTPENTQNAEGTKIAHRRSLAISTAEGGIAGNSAARTIFTPSQKKSRFASDFLCRGNRASWGLKKSRDCLGSGKNRRRSRRESRDFGALRPRTQRARGPKKNHSRSNAWKKNPPLTHEIFILAWKFHSRFEIFILDWKFQSQALSLFFCGQRGARNENFILESRLKISFRIESLIFSILPLEIDFFQSWGPLGNSMKFPENTVKNPEIHNLGRDMGGVQNVWGEENVPENALSRKFLDPSKRASGLLCRGFLCRKHRALTPEGVENVPYEGGSKTPFWEGCHSWGFPTPSFFHPPVASSE